MIGANAAAKRAALDRLEQQALNLTNPFMEYPLVLAWLARHGRTDGALAVLERHTQLGRIPYDFLRLSPDFKALAANPRFVRALGTARAQFDDTVGVLKEADARSELPTFMRQPLTDLLRTLGIEQKLAVLGSPRGFREGLDLYDSNSHSLSFSMTFAHARLPLP